MNLSAQVQLQDNFAKSIRWSLIAHGIFGALLVFRAVFYPSEAIFIQRAIRVDMVGLPAKSQTLPNIPNPAKPLATPAAVKPPEATPAPALKKLPDAKKPAAKSIDPKKLDLRKSTAEEDAIKRLQAFKKLAEMSKQRPQPDAQTKPSPPVRGSVLAAGSSVTGLNKIDYDSYLEKLDDKVKTNWNLPSLLKNQNLTATIVVYIDGSGNITKKILKKSSGNSVFDEKCLESIERSGPFESPPSKLANILAVDGIEFGFPE